MRKIVVVQDRAEARPSVGREGRVGRPSVGREAGNGPCLPTVVKAAALIAGIIGPAMAAPAAITLPGDRAFPENLTSTRDGTLFVGSMAEGGIKRAAPGATTAEPWIAPGAGGTRSTFGLLADESSGLLWVCSNDVSAWGIPGPGDAKGSWLKAFGIETGKLETSAALPGAGTVCNDIALGPDGGVYVTDVVGAGDAGEITTLATSRPLNLPDGLRPYGDLTFLMVEGGGTLDLVTVEGDTARIETLQDGLAGPVGVTQVGDTAWVAEGQLDHLFDPALIDKKPDLPFRIVAVPLPAR